MEYKKTFTTASEFIAPFNNEIAHILDQCNKRGYDSSTCLKDIIGSSYYLAIPGTYGYGFYMWLFYLNDLKPNYCTSLSLSPTVENSQFLWYSFDISEIKVSQFKRLCQYNLLGDLKVNLSNNSTNYWYNTDYYPLDDKDQNIYHDYIRHPNYEDGSKRPSRFFNSDDYPSSRRLFALVSLLYPDAKYYYLPSLPYTTYYPIYIPSINVAIYVAEKQLTNKDKRASDNSISLFFWKHTTGINVDNLIDFLHNNKINNSINKTKFKDILQRSSVSVSSLFETFNAPNRLEARYAEKSLKDLKPISYKERTYVGQYSFEGKLIAEYNTISEASKATGIGYNRIQDVLAQRAKTAGSYIWLRYTEYDRQKIIDSEEHLYDPLSNAKSIIQLDGSGRVLLEHPSIRSASRTTGIAEASIINALKGRTKKAGGYYWEYIDDDESET